MAPDHGGQPVPAVHGSRLLPPCETKCNRAQLDEAVGINSVERFLGDEGIAAAGGSSCRTAVEAVLVSQALARSAACPWPGSGTR